MSILTGDNIFADFKKSLQEKQGPCWSGFKKVPGKKDFEDGSCIKEEDEGFEDYWNALTEDEQIDYVEAMFEADGCDCEDCSDDMVSEDEKGHKRSVEAGAGLTQKGVDAYNRRTGGNLKTAVTTPPSKLKAGSKAAGRRKSFCARSRSWNGERGKAARRRWNC
jgi:hypothetical protein